MKKLLLLALCALLLSSLFGCYYPRPSRSEFITEDPPVRNHDEIYTEAVEEQVIRGYILAVSGEDLIRINVFTPDREMYGNEVYIRTTEIEDCYYWRFVTVTFDTIEKSKNPDDLPVLIAKSMTIEVPAAKPVIYLYPETPTEVSVNLTFNGHLTCTYPDYGKGWDNFTAYPDGTLIFPDGKEYYCLYWEGMQAAEWDFSTGFCVKGSDTATFLEWALAEQGLTPREANEFIIYWLPLMQGNPYNVIAFQTDAYTDGAVLEITPTPDSLLRVFMAYYPSDEAVEIAPQAFETPARDGFTVVEWGGSPIQKP